jgi:hypothetical protein
MDTDDWEEYIATNFRTRDESNMFVRNTDIHLQDYTMSQTKEPQSDIKYSIDLLQLMCNFNNIIFSDVTPCSAVEVHRRFWGTYYRLYG